MLSNSGTLRSSLRLSIFVKGQRHINLLHCGEHLLLLANLQAIHLHMRRLEAPFVWFTEISTHLFYTFSSFHDHYRQDASFFLLPCDTHPLSNKAVQPSSSKSKRLMVDFLMSRSGTAPCKRCSAVTLVISVTGTVISGGTVLSSV